MKKFIYLSLIILFGLLGCDSESDCKAYYANKQIKNTPGKVPLVLLIDSWIEICQDKVTMLETYANPFIQPQGYELQIINKKVKFNLLHTEVEYTLQQVVELNDSTSIEKNMYLLKLLDDDMYLYHIIEGKEYGPIFVYVNTEDITNEIEYLRKQ